MRPIPSTYELAIAKSPREGIEFDIYVVPVDGTFDLMAICLHGTKIDLYEVLDEHTLNHFQNLVDNYEPAKEARHERAMERAAARILCCEIG